jgi:hypothetical protein
VPRLIVELREDIRFEDGAWVPTDERTAALVATLEAACRAPRRLFSRPAAALDVEHVALCDAARRSGEKVAIPDLNLFYLLDGDAAAMAGCELVRSAAPLAPLPPPAPVTAGAAATVLAAPEGGVLADALDQAAAALGPGDTLVVPFPLADPGSRAAAEVAARRGVTVLTPEGRVGARAPGASPRPVRARVSLLLESVTLLAGGDRGTSELYVEGWVDDGVRTPFRVPQSGARRGVRRGVAERFDAPLWDGIPRGEGLIVHLEVWEEDMGRDSLIDPDDLLGVYERRFTEAERWGEGRHEDLRVATEDGAAILTFVVGRVAC